MLCSSQYKIENLVDELFIITKEKELRRILDKMVKETLVLAAACCGPNIVDNDCLRFFEAMLSNDVNVISF